MKTFFRILGFLAILIVIFSIFIATRSSSYDVKQTQLIKAPPAVIFNTINEYKTWMDWGPWKKNDPTIIPSYGEKTSGVGASYSWTSEQDGPGRMETLDLIENKSINQKIYFNKRDDSDVYWDLEYTEKGTKVTWGMKGDLGFMGKMFFTIMGGSDKVLGKMFEDGLSGLDEYVHVKMDTYSISNSGIVEYGGGYYIHLTTECSFDDMGAKLDKMLPKVLIYAMQNNYPRAGDIFTLYHKYDEKNKRVEFSSCIPVKERVDPKGDIALAFMESGRYHKTTLQGAYKYSQEAWEKAFEFAKTDGIEVIENGKPFEVYTKGHTDSPNPADWVTEIYLPVE
jgi:effector-binding domain-containing protein